MTGGPGIRFIVLNVLSLTPQNAQVLTALVIKSEQFLLSSCRSVGVSLFGEAPRRHTCKGELENRVMESFLERCRAAGPRILLAIAVSLGVTTEARTEDSSEQFRLMTFNILQGGGRAANVGFPNSAYGGSRIDEIAAVIRLAHADVVGVQEDARGEQLLRALGKGWNRAGNVYSRFPMRLLRQTSGMTSCEVDRPIGEGRSQTVLILNVHWSPSNYGPFLMQEKLLNDGVPTDRKRFVMDILKRSDRSRGPRGIDATLSAVNELLKLGHPLFITGDFNEPSHLDWSRRFESRGEDRWVENPTAIPLRFEVPWPGSIRLFDAGMSDAYRQMHPSETDHPGNTWTPPYPNDAPGRRPYNAQSIAGKPVPLNQVLDRIDRIYFFRKYATISKCSVVGESKETSDLVFKDRWPSDHRAVIADFEMIP